MSPIPRPWMGLLAFLIALGLHALLLSGLVLGREGAAAPPPTPSFELVTLAPPALPARSVAPPAPEPVSPPEPEPAPPPPPEVDATPPPKAEPKPPPRARPKPRPQRRVGHRPKARPGPKAALAPRPPLPARPQAQRLAMASAPKGSEGPVYQPPDAFAAYLHNPAPVYPRRARRRRHQGLVLIRVQVSTDGRPLAVELARSSGHKELDRAALAAVKGWRFRPAQRGGKAVTARVEVPVRFRLKKG